MTQGDGRVRDSAPHPLVSDCGVCVLSAVAILVIGLVLGRSRSSASL
ncbi:hypothetical protein [Propionibacterium acidifaciens]|nr:hypothetical protein [Propionibacterium acidifaciens]